MSSRTLWIVVVIVIIIAGGWYLISQNSSTQTPLGATQTTSGGPDYTPGGTAGNDTGMETGTITGNASVSVNTQGYDAMMDWSANGFNPTTLTIKKGQTVRFMNNDASASFWPASDIHPTHSLYPEKSSSDCLGSSFDACKAIGPGQYWDFTFNDAGSWGCHNHLRASQKCTVVVQ